MRYLALSFRLLAVLVVLNFVLQPLAGARAQNITDPLTQAKALLSDMTPEERVGQLFLVTFKGRDVGKNSQIYDLIVNHHIGGVVLSTANDNFTGPENTVADAFRLTSALQSDEYAASQGVAPTPAVSKAPTPNFIPLFIGISQEGDLYPYDQIISGMTPLPDLMAIGATWNPSVSKQVGSVLGSELSSFGFNLFLGPSLDVLDVLQTEIGEDLGTRTFGGDPYWVGTLGKAYIEGLHQGSGERMVVVAKHFPGRGGSDRPPEEEVATVRKSLEQLKQIELAPFFAVTGDAPSVDSTTDGLLVSHIRYQGFQGNIRATTRPVSFDPAALDQIMGLPEFASWRRSGGVIVSDDLGSQAVRKFFDPTGQSFDARQVARNAFLAGNDLLYMDNFIATGDPDVYTSIIRTLDLFTQKYREDSAFAQRVDTSVVRLLTLKYKIYKDFELQNVLPDQSGLQDVGRSQKVIEDVAQKAGTLISPDPSELSSVLPRPPELRERIVFITDVRSSRQCTICAEQTAMPADALENSVLRLYGPLTGGQISRNRLSSYTMGDLLKVMAGALPNTEPPQLASDLKLADWVVFSVLNVQSDSPESQALRKLLSEQPELIRNKKVIVFAFNAPYYLDATDISKLTAYYALYSKTPPFIDVAARILFQELAPTGTLPVSVPGIGYDLITATSPDPTQVIPLMLDTPETPQSEKTPSKATTTVTPTPVPLFKVGDTLPLRTGMIYDHNRNPVPDGTVVRFLFIAGGDTSTTQQIETVTTQGVAHASYRIQNPGLMEIRVVSDPASTSEILRLNILPGQASAITEIAPTTQITVTATPTETVTVTPSATPTPVPPPPVGAGFGRWLLLVILIWGSSAAVYWFGSRSISTRWGVRWGLMAALGGLISNLIDGISNKSINPSEANMAGSIFIALLGVITGWCLGWLWKRWLDGKAHPRTERNNSH
jgi:beta-N-acetylhexosaminidase